MYAVYRPATDSHATTPLTPPLPTFRHTVDACAEWSRNPRHTECFVARTDDPRLRPLAAFRVGQPVPPCDRCLINQPRLRTRLVTRCGQRTRVAMQ